jgi:hypothetical protein
MKRLLSYPADKAKASELFLEKRWPDSKKED